MNFREITKNEFSLNPFELKNKWMLISAQKDGIANTMTASWGGFGVMWGKEVVFVVIRPQRYTKEFIDAADNFSLSFFDETYKKDLSYLGKVSGRDENKIGNTSLSLTFSDNIPHFEEAEYVIFVRKLYMQAMGAECFLDENIEKHWYPNADHHILYIGEVIKYLKNKTL